MRIKREGYKEGTKWRDRYIVEVEKPSIRHMYSFIQYLTENSEKDFMMDVLWLQCSEIGKKVPIQLDHNETHYRFIVDIDAIPHKAFPLKQEEINSAMSCVAGFIGKGLDKSSEVSYYYERLGVKENGN